MPSFCFISKSVRATLLCYLILVDVPFSHAQELGIQWGNSEESVGRRSGTSPIPYKYHPIPGDNDNELPLGEEALRKTFEDVQHSLQEREIEHGPYHTSIAENLLKLAKVHVALKEYEQARDIINRALEVQRISTGLYSTEQIPIVERQILVNRVLERWEDVDKNFEFLYWLYRRALGENTPELIPLLGHYTDWKIEVLNRELFNSRLPFIKSALKATKHANAIIRSTPKLQEIAPYFIDLESALKEANKIESALNRPNF